MDVLSLADVDGHGHSGVRHRVAGEGLRGAQPRPVGCRVIVAGQLDEEERPVGSIPDLAPGLDHRREQLAVFLGIYCIAFALIPHDTARRIGNQRRDHVLVEHGGAFRTPWVAGVWRTRIRRRRSLSVLFPRCLLALPFLEGVCVNEPFLF